MIKKTLPYITLINVILIGLSCEIRYNHRSYLTLYVSVFTFVFVAIYTAMYIVLRRKGELKGYGWRLIALIAILLVNFVTSLI